MKRIFKPVKRVFGKEEEQVVTTNTGSNSEFSDTNRKIATDLTEELVRDNTEAGIPTIEVPEEESKEKETRPTGSQEGGLTSRLIQMFQKEFYEYLAEKAAQDPNLRRKLLAELKMADKTELLNIIEAILEKLEQKRREGLELEQREQELMKKLESILEKVKEQRSTLSKAESYSGTELENLDL